MLCNYVVIAAGRSVQVKCYQSYILAEVSGEHQVIYDLRFSSLHSCVIKFWWLRAGASMRSKDLNNHNNSPQLKTRI